MLTASVGRAVDRVAERAVGERPLAHAQRAHQRLLVADRALVRVRRDDRDVADRIERLLEREQPARLDPVVVGDEDPRPAGPVAQRPGRPCAAPAVRRGPPRRRPARRAPCRGRAARSGPARGSCPGGRRSRAACPPCGGAGTARRRGSVTSSTSAALPGHRFARDPDRPALALAQALGGASGHRCGRRTSDAGSGRRRPRRPPRSGCRRSRPGCPRCARR